MAHGTAQVDQTALRQNDDVAPIGKGVAVHLQDTTVMVFKVYLYPKIIFWYVEEMPFTVVHCTNTHRKGVNKNNLVSKIPLNQWVWKKSLWTFFSSQEPPRDY